MKNAETQQMTQVKERKNILSTDINVAMRELVRISKQLVEFTHQETQKLITQDYLGFALTMQEKENLAQRYTQASEEFRSRLDEFKHADQGMVMQLNKLQMDLKDKSENNNRLIDQIRKRAQTNTTETLFAAQELGQRVTFPGDAERAQYQAEKMKRNEIKGEVRA